MRAVHVVTRLNVGGIARFLNVGCDAVDLLIRGVAEPAEAEASWPGEQLVLPDLRRPLRPGADRRALTALTAALERVQRRLAELRSQLSPYRFGYGRACIGRSQRL